MPASTSLALQCTRRRLSNNSRNKLNSRQVKIEAGLPANRNAQQHCLQVHFTTQAKINLAVELSDLFCEYFTMRIAVRLLAIHKRY